MKNKKSGIIPAADLLLAAFAVLFTVFVTAPFSRGWDTRLTAALRTVSPSETDTTSVEKTEKNEETAAPPETEYPEVVTKAEKKENNTVADGDFSDIKALQNEYLAAYAGKEPQGKVSEEFFQTKGATDILGSVAVKNATASQKPDFAALLEEGAPLEKADYSAPTVLIFHTHTTESYLMADNGVFYDGYQTRSTEPGRNMVRVGDEICAVLEKNGIGVIHDTQIYDSAYDGAYARSRKTVLEYLEKYPTIQIVLDVHRDAIYYSDTLHCKPTAVINGAKAAQVMIITGAEEGQISDFPDWEENLKFALALQKTAQDKYEGLMRPIYFCQRKYNMDTAKCSLLLEIGSDANTLEEACRSAGMIGETLVKLIRMKDE